VKKKFLLSAAAAVVVVAATFGMTSIIKMARASNAAQVVTTDKGADSVIVETMRSCIVTVTTQGLTDAGVNQAYRLCWNRAELVGKTHKGH
jgi:uncharacterized protein YecT (DUF1311 family)